ncbi:unnamed protein product [Tuber aestivum]|uniref:Glycine cleavage system H protein n=1 Tax=Tuber aestivum TaxID=59557 RepID=A0A292Q6M5_9PEZI|nr:unnamed protein product [Tuber aestivum]
MASLLRSLLTRPVFKPAYTTRVVVHRRNFTCLRNTPRTTNGSFYPNLAAALVPTLLPSIGRSQADRGELPATVGITEYAQKALGEVVYVELPRADAEVEAGEVVGAVESVKSASDILSPLSGTIVEANNELGNNPKLINKSAEGDGWICKIKVDDPEDIEALMSKEDYDAHVKGMGH